MLECNFRITSAHRNMISEELGTSDETRWMLACLDNWYDY